MVLVDRICDQAAVLNQATRFQGTLTHAAFSQLRKLLLGNALADSWFHFVSPEII